MPDCVCGCPHAAHHEQALSVPLLPREDGPLYDVTGPLQTARTYREATYTTHACTECGCGDYLELPA